MSESVKNSVEIIENFIKPIEKFLNQEISNSLNISNNRYNYIKCRFKFPNSISIGSNLEIQFYSFKEFQANINNLRFHVAEKAEVQSLHDSDKLFLSFILNQATLKQSKIFKFFLEAFEKFIFEYVNFVENNISTFAESMLERFRENKFEGSNYFEKPEFLIYKIQESKSTFHYKRGEGYRESTTGRNKYLLDKNNDLPNGRETNILTFLENKKSNFSYTENGYSFLGNHNDYESYSEILDVSTTKFLLNFEGNILNNQEFEKFYIDQYQSLSRNHLYLFTYIVHCDLNSYFATFKPDYSESNDLVLIKKYYRTLYYIAQIIYGEENYNYHCLFEKDSLDDFIKYEIPNFEYIVTKVKDIFTDEIDIYFDYFLINSNNTSLDLETIFYNVISFLKSQKVQQ